MRQASQQSGIGRIFVTMMLLGITLTFFSCADPQEYSQASLSGPADRIFRLNLGTEPPNLDPAKVDDLTSYMVILPLLKGLVGFDREMQIRPALAQSWEVQRNGLRYVFHLRPDARWSDGQPVTSRDFKYAWLRVLKPETAAPYAFFLYEIENAQAYYEGQLKDASRVGIAAPDDHTLVVDLRRPTPFFLQLAASPVMFPLRRDLIERDGERFTEAGHFLSNGAYQLAQWAHEEKIRLTPNPYFYEKDPAKRPGVSAIDMQMVSDANTSVVMYENNELDFIETTTSIPAFDVRRLRKKPEARTGPLHRINYFGFNVTKPPFDNVKVRQAFAYALDRSYYPRLMQSGQKPIASWISPGLTGYNPKVGLQFDPQKAKRLLAEAGYPDGRGFPQVTLAFMTQYDTQKEAEIAQFLWKKILNVDVRLENMEWKVFLSRLDEDPPQIYRLGWFVDYPDADSYMNVFLSDSGNNHSRWKNPLYDSLVDQAVVTLDPAARQKLYDRAQRLLLEQETVIVPIYLAEKTWLVKPWAHGLEINALNLPDYDRLHIRR